MIGFQQKKILVTGGTGSFGVAVVKRLLDYGAKEVRVFSRDEKKQNDLRVSLDNPRAKFFLGDIRDPQSLKDSVRDVDFIFHAAALKQVPSCEFFPIEAVKTNILGSHNLIEAAEDFSVKKVIFLSTDKAVAPINAMGQSKALMEKLMIARGAALQPGGVTYTATRYGNVMGSRGSVIPLFIDAILGGRPLTVTDPSMTRFLMSLDESVDLVLRAFADGKQGEILVHKAPSATIGTVAQALLKISGSSRSQVEIIGIRKSEKLNEVLVSKEEMGRTREDGLFFRIGPESTSLEYEGYFSEGGSSIFGSVEYASNSQEPLTLDQTINLLLKVNAVKVAFNV